MQDGKVASGSTGMRAAAMAVAIASCLAGLALAGAAPAWAHVLRVGKFNGSAGSYPTIAAALAKSEPGDWILIGPGDYKESVNTVPPGAKGDERAGAAVLVTKPGVHIRGMNRNTVVLDGTKPGAVQCGGGEAEQSFGPLDESGKPTGRNGLVVFKAAETSVENLTACNFLTGDKGGGDILWFDGGGASGEQHLGSWRGAYLSATSSYYAGKTAPFSSYGIYASNTFGPGLFTQVYANNQADAAFYIGACPDCNTILDHAHAENSDLGYSGTNSGGHLIIQNSEFNDNQSGFVTNSQNNDDAPSPQDGACPNRGTGPTGTHSCWLFTKNSVHDNNNPNVPTTGSAAAGPVGSGVVIAGGRNDTVSGNKIYNNGAWGVLLVPYPATEEPPPVAHCEGGVGTTIEGKAVCYFDDWGSEISNNTLTNNGFFANHSNVDLAEISNLENPGNCWHGNVDTSGTVTSEPMNIQSPPHSECGIPDAGESLASPLGAQVACDTGFFTECPSTVVANYPKETKVVLQPLPAQPTMPNPCLDVPRNPWCATNPVKPPPYPVPGSPAE
jgi:Periplasmic copper-binding protein (NosD)